MLHWTLGNSWFTSGVACAVAGVALTLPAGERITKSKSPVTKSASGGGATSVKPGAGLTRSLVPWTTRKIIRAQDNPFEEEWQPETQIGGRARVTPVSATEPAVESQATETPAASTLATDVPSGSGDSAALQRLKERSAKERWEKLHQEWLKARKKQAVQIDPPESAPTSESAPATANDFEPLAEPAETKLLDLPAAPAGDGSAGDNAGVPEAVEAVPEQPATEGSVRAPRIEPGRVRLQSQPRPRPDVKSDAELNKLFQNEDGERLAPPVRTPAELPKISEINPVPKPRSSAPGRQVPEEDPKRYVRLGHVPYESRISPEFVYAWEATNFKHHPLYFEDAPLERYGHALPEFLQPVVSIARFSGQLAFLPYQMTIHPPCSKVSPLGWYAPGDCVPYRCYPIPLNGKAAAVQAATILVPSYALP